jgi:hypothetical protein
VVTLSPAGIADGGDVYPASFDAEIFRIHTVVDPVERAVLLSPIYIISLVTASAARRCGGRPYPRFST